MNFLMGIFVPFDSIKGTKFPLNKGSKHLLIMYVLWANIFSNKLFTPFSQN